MSGSCSLCAFPSEIRQPFGEDFSKLKQSGVIGIGMTKDDDIERPYLVINVKEKNTSHEGWIKLREVPFPPVLGQTDWIVEQSSNLSERFLLIRENYSFRETKDLKQKTDLFELSDLIGRLIRGSHHRLSLPQKQ